LSLLILIIPFINQDKQKATEEELKKQAALMQAEKN